MTPSSYRTQDPILSTSSTSPQAMSTQRPFFLSTIFSALRQTPSLPTQNKPPSTTTYTSATRTITTTATTTTNTTNAASQSATSQPTNRLTPRPIPAATSPQHRRGSNSSSEGFRDVIGSDAWYIGGRTAGGEEQFFKLGVIRRVRSNDGLSLDRLSL